MNQPEFRKPLLQAGIILGVVVVFFLFVASSGADGFVSGLSAIFSGVFSSIVFLLGLIFSIVFSVVLLVALFLGAVALSSVDRAKEYSRQLLATLSDTWKISATYIERQNIRCLQHSNSQSAEILRLNKEIVELKNLNSQLQETLNSMNDVAREQQTRETNEDS